jgi:hypothetical protein
MCVGDQPVDRTQGGETFAFGPDREFAKSGSAFL